MGSADWKTRFGGWLENPYLSRLQRDLLDCRRQEGVAKVLSRIKPANILDIGCGLGENSRICASDYVGIDNSAPRIFYASRHYPSARFILGDGVCLPVKPRSFDCVMLLDTSHHLTDAQFAGVVRLMAAASRRWVLVSDAVLYEGQSPVSRFFYSLDRGMEFRTAAQIEALLDSCPEVERQETGYFMTFPGIYRRGAFLLRVR